jgi:hypothetical protein
VAGAGVGAGLTAAGGAAGARTPSGAEWVDLPGTSPPSPTSFGAKVIGPAPAGALVNLQVYFQPSGSEQLAGLATAISTPGNPSYHHYLTVSQFAALFGPSTGQVASLDRYLSSQGLSVGPLQANHLSQNVTGTVGDAGRAFGTSFWTLQDRGGSVVVGSLRDPGLPAQLAGSVAFIGGLDPWVSETNNLVRLAPPAQHPQPAQGRQLTQERRPAQGQAVKAASASLNQSAAAPQGASSAAALGGATDPTTGTACPQSGQVGLSPAELASAYGLSSFYAKGYQGAGQTIGLIEYALPDAAAISTFEQCVGASITVDYDPTSSPPSTVDPEVAADVEVIAALAPQATVAVYESSQAGTGLAPWEQAVSGTAAGGLPSVISSSWGSCEPNTDMGSAYYDEEQALFEEAATQGQTILVASGDNGSEGCLDETGSKVLAVEDPASAPEVTAVGGTGSDTVNGPQYVWNSHGAPATACLGTGCGRGASGGGSSLVWPRPSYQPATLAPAATCDGGSQGCRQIPDVSALAGDPYGQYCSPSVCGGSGWLGFGGTSLAAPSWGVAVLLSDSACSAKVGFLNPLLYSEPAKLTSPVTSGNNDLTGTNAGLYSASPSGGYSMAAGLGYLGEADLSSGALCGPTTPAPGPVTSTSSGGTGYTSLVPTPPAYSCAKATTRLVLGRPLALAATEDTNGCAGYWVVTKAGDVANFGSATDYGTLRGVHLKAPIVGIAATPSGDGYWLVGADGGVFAFGHAGFHGSAGSLRLSSPIVGMASTPDGKGYWLAAKDGGVFAYGDARFYGSAGQLHLNQPIVGIAPTPSGQGYWLASSGGGVFSFGNARYRGPSGAAKQALKLKIVGISAGAGGSGYRLAATNGSVLNFGAHVYGNLSGSMLPVPLVSIAPSPDSRGYYLVDSAGDVFAFGDAVYLGNVTN